MVVDFQNTPASIEDDFKMYYSDAHVAGEVDPNSLITIAERLDTAGIYTTAEMEAVADAYLSDAGGEAIARAMGPIKERWQNAWKRARLSKDNELKDSLRAFRADTISYRNAWQFLSQIVDYQDPVLHKRAIVATLLSRNLHMDGNQYDDSYLEGVQLSGVQLVPSAINEDHSLSEGSAEPMVLPGFDGEFRGGQTPTKGPLAEVIDRVNDMFRARNVDVTEGSVAGFITTFWGFLGENDAAQAMAKKNSPSQLKASADFKNAVGVAMVRTCQENQEIQSYMTDQSFLDSIVEITAEALQAHYSRGGESAEA
jgi:type I restriction enzyme R subunit